MAPLPAPTPEDTFPVICLVASAGGLDPLTFFFRDVPASSGMAFLVLQHHAPDQHRALPALLARNAAIPFRLAKAGDVLRPDQALVLTGGMTLGMAEGRIQVQMARPVETSGMPGDLVLRSLAECIGERAVGVVLSGSGADGTCGLRAIQEKGGVTLVQDPATASQDGMPRRALEAGVVDGALPVGELFARILVETAGLPGRTATAPDLAAICAALAQRTGNDFTHYKPGTLNRRIQRRMHATGSADLTAYRVLLEGSPEELSALLKDLLISVTEFFRDPDAFDALMIQLGPLLRAGDGEPLRVWVPGCASGEEAYSLAIRIREVLDAAGSVRRVQIFATDIDSSAIMRAKAGRYPEEALRNVSAERRRAFFTNDLGAWVVDKGIRAMCSFSLQNILRDPPFSSLHLVSCRNVFIYLQPALQAKLIPLFHFALKPGGILFLGSSEGLASNPLLFEPVDKTSRVFTRRDVDRPPVEFPVGERRLRVQNAPQGNRPPADMSARTAALGLFEQMLLTYYLPASAIVNEAGEVLYWAGQIGKYLTPGLGQPSSNILTNTSGPLHWELRRLLGRASVEPSAAIQTVVSHDVGNGEERLRLTLRPMPGLDREARIYALIIQAEAAEAGVESLPRLPDADQPLLDQMNLELQSTRVELQITVEELEATNEELQSSNEELQSSNEELQASQEELRSVNEELRTLNLELNEKVQELHEANGDLQNLMASTNIPTLFLDQELRISRFTPTATKLFGLLATDVGRPIGDLVPLFTGMDLPELAQEVLDFHQAREAQVHTRAGDHWYLVRLNPYRNLDQTVNGVVVTFAEFTDIRRAQMAAMDNEARYRNLFRNLVSGFAHCRMRFEGDRPADFLYLSVNDAFETQTGIRDPVGHWITELAPGIREQDEELFEIYGRVARGGRPERFETYVKALDDWFDISVYSPHPDEFVAIFDVITSRKRAEEALQESEGRYRSLFESSLAVMLVIDPADAAIVAANPAAASFYGWTRSDLQSMTVMDLNILTPERVRTNMALAQSGHRNAFSARHRLADGRIRDVEVFSSPIVVGGELRLYSIVQDVTERRQAEEAAREAGVKLETALASMADAVSISDLEGRFLEFNDSFATFHRFADKSECARTFAEYPDILDVFLPTGEPATVDQWAVPRALRGETAVNAEYILRRKDTGVTWVGSYNLAPLRDADGRIFGSVVTARDITAQKAAVDKLIESEERFRTVFEASPDAILVRKPGGCFLEANQVALDRYGYTREELLSMRPEDLVPPRLAGEVDGVIQEALRTGVPIEWAHMRKDGTEIPVELLLRVFNLNGTPCIYASARDIRERKRAQLENADLQDQLQQAQKMESLGRLAGGIAHDMNNVLGAIFAVTQALQSRFGADQAMTDALAIVERAAMRGRDLVKGLVGFARKERTARAPVDINDLVRKEVALLEHTLLQKYQLIVSLEEPLPLIQGETGTLGSALMNLCVNAVDAMPGGGTLGIRTRHGEARTVQILVEDTGQGMSPEVLQRAMEPFYTTKPVGKGTGLGLSMVFNTVRAHGGSLTINSQEGKGTQVLMTLPILADEADEAEAGNALAQTGSALRILVVDDDELLRSPVPLMLRVLGHQVEAVDGGRAALDYLSRETVPDLVILDMNMPGMTGTEALGHLRERFRDLPVLLATGFMEPDAERLAEEDPFTLIIAKPFSFEEIHRKFSQVAAMRSQPAQAPAPEDAGAAAPEPPAPEPEPEVRAGKGEPLGILLIEDNPIDALVIEGLLQKGDLACNLRRIERPAELDAALAGGGIDVVLAGYRARGWSGMEVVRQVRTFDAALPVLVISGEAGEELAVEAMRAGAADFLLKDRLLRLVAAIERALSGRPRSGN